MGTDGEAVIPLSDTLVAFVESLAAVDAPGIAVESATMDVPLEGRVVEIGGTPTFFAHAPHSRWRAGLLPPVHVAHMHVVEGEE